MTQDDFEQPNTNLTGSEFMLNSQPEQGLSKPAEATPVAAAPNTQVSPYSYVPSNQMSSFPTAPAVAQRPVYPEPSRLPTLASQQTGYYNTKPSSSSGSSIGKALMAFVAGGLVAAVAFATALLVAESNDDVASPARTVTSVAEVSADELTPLVESGGVESAIAVADALGPAVVQIEVAGNSGLGAGSGVVYREDLVITNNHVVDGASTVRVRQDTGRVFEAEVVGTNERVDIAVLRIPDSDLPVAQLATEEPAQVGQSAIAIGSPFLLQQTVTQGIVSAINRPIATIDQNSFIPMIQTDAPINQGNSGGALADINGRVIGINTSIQTDGTSSTNAGVGFAIPIDIAVETADQLLTGEAIEPGFLGLFGEQPLDGSAGVEITDITAGSAAASSSLQVGDVVQSLDGAPVTNIAELAGLVSVNAPGDVVTLQVVRGSEELEIDVAVGRR